MAENFKFNVISNEQDQIIVLELGGMLVLENVQTLKDKLIGIAERLSSEVVITISELDEIDLSNIQIIVAFIRSMHESDISFRVEWDIDDDQKLLLEHVGISNELLMNN
jgi:anti-anti-sigma regulatory factor